MCIRRASIITALFIVMAADAENASAEDSLARAKALYDSAMYAEALQLLDGLATDPRSEVHQYRALCLIAVGRLDTAEREIAIVVGADPFFLPNPDEVSPRVISMFSAARRRLLPPMVRRIFGEATTLFRDGQREQAVQRFDEVIQLLDDAELREDQSLVDLRLVATAFVELVRAKPLPLPSRPAIQASMIERAEPVQPRSTATVNAPVFTRPVAIDQVLPEWNPPSTVLAKRTYTGAIKLAIDEQGRVTEATKERTVHPFYDPIVLEAARSWRYQPATRDGQPIRSETTVEIRLEPPQDPAIRSDGDRRARR